MLCGMEKDTTPTLLAAIYSPPLARVGFGRNAVLVVICVSVALPIASPFQPDRDTAGWILAYGSAALLSVLGAWPCGRWRPVRALMLLARLLWFGVRAWATALTLTAGGRAGIINYPLVFIFVIVLAGALPPSSALWAHVDEWPQGRG
jgi:hypothetical protein